MKDIGERRDRRRCFLGPLENQRAAGTQCGADFANGLVEREVPRRECATHAHRSFNHQLANLGISSGDQSSIQTLAFFSVPFHVFRTKTHLRSEEHTSELQSLMRTSYAVFCLNKNKTTI